MSGSSTERIAADRPDPERGLRRSLGLRQLIGNGLVFIGPAAPVGIFGLLYAKSGGAVVTVYIIATLIMTLTALSYAQMSRVIPAAGSVYSYATAGIGRGAGFVAGWMVLLDYLLIPSVAFLFTGLAMHSFLPAVPAWIFTALAVVVTTGLNLSGGKSLARAAMAVVIAEVTVLVVVLVAAVAAIAANGSRQAPLAPLVGADGFSAAAVLGAVSIAAMAFLGFDAIATFAEESAGSSRMIGKAMLACLVIAGVLFLVQSYVVELVTVPTPASLAAAPESQGTAFYDAIRSQVAPWLATLLGIAKALGASFAGMMGLAAGSRVVMTMARERRFPKVFGTVRRNGSSPALATVLVTAATLVLAVWASIAPDGLDLLSSTVSIGAMSAFILLHASVVGYFMIRRRSRNRLLHLAVPVLGVLFFLVVIAFANASALTVGAVWLAVGLVVAVIQARRRAAE
ncbi:MULTISPECIES: APC family permease [Arthrobacter]|uniref:APC family permease n=2 Tax=Arthrobacter TaxID=1663 RepID=A0ABU9KTA4_9MICC|nr:APC family permease [Arthrobacter sp. YJM1]MDP5228717.1 APC family permease [Arthrobacter sp. YJM1]